MTFIERVNYYAKGILTGIGAVITFGVVVVEATKDGSIDGGDISTLIAAALVLITTVIAVVKKENIKPSVGVE